MSEYIPNVVVVSAPSGAGKSTVLARVLDELPGLRFSVSHTTRAPRQGETEGVHYHFVDRAVFEGLKHDGSLLEWAEVHGHLYGTSLAEYDSARRDRLDLLLDLDVQGASQVRSKFRDTVSVFILPPSHADLEKRLRGRGQDDEATVRRRLEAAREELAFYAEYDYAIINADLGRCVEALKAVIQAARYRRSRSEGTARKILATFAKHEES